MTDYTPTHDEMHVAWFQYKLALTSDSASAAIDAHDEFRRYRAEVERAAAARAFAQGVEAALDTTGQHGLGLLTLIGNPYAAALGLTAGRGGESDELRKIQ